MGSRTERGESASSLDELSIDDAAPLASTPGSADARLRGENAALRVQVGKLTAERDEARERCLRLEEKNNDLVLLYIAARRLVEALGREEVLQAMEEVIVNLVGSEQYGIYEVGSDARTLSVVSGIGVAEEMLRVRIGEGTIGGVAQTGRPYVCRSAADLASERDLTACLPLKLDTSVTGVVAIFRLLPQKPRLEPVDLDIFELLMAQGAMSLYCAHFPSMRPTVRPARRTSRAAADEDMAARRG